MKARLDFANFRLLIDSLTQQSQETFDLGPEELAVCTRSSEVSLRQQRLSSILGLRELLDTKPLKIKYHPSGKPYVEDNPRSISISHKEQAFLVGVAAHQNVGLGVDLEFLRDSHDWDKILHRLFSDKVLQQWADLNLPAEFRESLMGPALWTLREAHFKATQKELRLPRSIHVQNLKHGVYQGVLATSSGEPVRSEFLLLRSSEWFVSAYIEIDSQIK